MCTCVPPTWETMPTHFENSNKASCHDNRRKNLLGGSKSTPESNSATIPAVLYAPFEKTVPEHENSQAFSRVVSMGHISNRRKELPVNRRSSLSSPRQRFNKSGVHSPSCSKTVEKRLSEPSDDLYISSVSARKKEFVFRITRPSNRLGFVICRLCGMYVWGPNGKCLHDVFSSMLQSI